MTEPTDRSMPPAMLTSVMPIEMTPTIDAARRIVRMLLTLRKVSGAVTAPTITRRRSATTSPRLRPTEPDRKRRHAGAGSAVTVEGEGGGSVAEAGAPRGGVGALTQLGRAAGGERE